MAFLISIRVGGVSELFIPLYAFSAIFPVLALVLSFISAMVEKHKAVIKFFSYCIEFGTIKNDFHLFVHFLLSIICISVGVLLCWKSRICCSPDKNHL